MVGTVELHPPLVAAMLRPGTYPHRVTRIRLQQTHVSWLFFTGTAVYKVKKPVSLGFLDFTTLKRRKRYCQLEVSLNSRLSPEVYLGVSEIRLHHGEYFLDDRKGRVVDYAVKMKQLGRSNSLDQRLGRGVATLGDMRQIAEKVASFHQRAATGPAITRLGDWSVVVRNALENLQQLNSFADIEVPALDLLELDAYTRAMLDTKAARFKKRANQGRILEGHGDLHCANIFLEDGKVQIIDCIEFNDRFRCLDPVEDIAFLAMDLEYFGRSDLSRGFVGEYQRLSGDSSLLELLDFFKVYRALVRAKINCFLLADPELPKIRKKQVRQAVRGYFGLACETVAKARGMPAVIAVGGLSGSGKTTIAAALSERWGAVHLCSDAIRKELAGVPAEEHRYEDFGKGIYAPRFTRLTYQRMFVRARRALGQGKAVFLDASFVKRSDRVAAGRLATEQGVPFRLVQCVAPHKVLLERLEIRGDATLSDARLPILREQRRRWEHAKNTDPPWIKVATNRPLGTTLRQLMKEIFKEAEGENLQPPRSRAHFPAA